LGKNLGQEALSGENKKLWKTAVRLNLCLAQKNAKFMLETDKSLPQTQKVQLTQSVEQLKIVLELLDTESNPIILEKLFGDNYATESIAQYRATTKKIADRLTTFAQKIGFSALKAACFDQYHQEPIKNSEIYPNVYFSFSLKNSSVSNSQKQCPRFNVVPSCQTCF
jgi:hypothetical protein